MTKNKHVTNRKPVEVKTDIKEPVKVESISAKYNKFKALIEAYKVQNPVKYEAKKEALEEQLKKLK